MQPFSRRTLLRASAVAGATLFIPIEGKAFPVTSTTQAASLTATGIAKYVSPLVVPPAMPVSTAATKSSPDHYVIGVRQTLQQVLPAGMPATSVFAYGSQQNKGTFSYPGYTLETQANRPIKVTWVNSLVDSSGRYQPHLLPVDPTLHWANPAGGLAGRDSHGEFTSTPGPYTGPVPIVTHLHGAHVGDESDGFPEAWYLPDATNIPGGYARSGSAYDGYAAKFSSQFGDTWGAGNAKYWYTNDQAAGMLWYHDHTLGMTRLNVYAGAAGMYFVRGGAYDLPAGVLPGPAPVQGQPAGTPHYEIPLTIQDRSFNQDGSLFFPDSREYFDGFTGPYIPFSDIPPLWNPEFFGDTMVVNGRTWPDLPVERRRYRFRILNSCGARFMMLKIASVPDGRRPAKAALPFWQVGADGGFLPQPQQLDRLLIAPAERVDVIVDFSKVAEGTRLYLINEGPDEPYGGGEPGVDFDPANPSTTGQVLRFSVVARKGTDTSTPPSQLKSLPAQPKPPVQTRTRQVALLEMDSEVLDGVGPRVGSLGIVDSSGPRALGWSDPVTENPAVGATEMWEIVNTTEDAHPIHVHLVQFQVVERESPSGVRKPEPGETGVKDTVIAYPGETTRLRATFDKAGTYVWHCHILDHEDHEMMRRFRVGP